MILSNLHRHRLSESHIIMCALKHGRIKLIACCVHASLHIFTAYYSFPYLKAQNRTSTKNSHSCPFPNVSQLNPAICVSILVTTEQVPMIYCPKLPIWFRFEAYTVIGFPIVLEYCNFQNISTLPIFLRFQCMHSQHRS